MKTYKLLGLAFFIFLSLLGCKGSSDGDKSTDPNKVFSLDKLNSLEKGVVYEAELKRNYFGDKPSPDYTVFLKITNLDKDYINISSSTDPVYAWVTPRDIEETWYYINGQYDFTKTIYEYYDDYNFLVETYQLGNGSCLPESVSNKNKYPTKIKIGDSGSLGEYKCHGLLSHEYSWLTGDGFNGNIIFKTVTVKKDDGKNSGKEEVSYKINGNGDIIGFAKSFYTYENGEYKIFSTLSNF